MMGRVGWKATWRGPEVGRPSTKLASVIWPARGVEGDMARARGRASVDEARLGQLAGGGIEAEHEGTVEAQVRDHHERAGGIEHDIMRMRADLAHAMRPGRALGLDELRL